MVEATGSPALLTAREVAASLRVSPDTVYTMLRQRRIPSMRFGPRLTRIRGEALAEFMAAAETSQGAPTEATT